MAIIKEGDMNLVVDDGSNVRESEYDKKFRVKDHKGPLTWTPSNTGERVNLALVFAAKVIGPGVALARGENPFRRRKDNNQPHL